MDFTMRYTEEQERFRQEVRAWIEKNVPEEMKEPVDPRDFSKEQYLFWRERHKELAAKGWLYPTFPREYGGGGLTPEHETILEEEFTTGRVVRNFTNTYVFPALLVWGTEEQRERFLRPFLTSEKTAWQALTEPQSGSDLANVQTRAVRDGDDWVISGQKVFISGRPRPQWDAGGPDYVFGPVLTDPDAPRHRNLGYFIVPHPSPGLSLQEMTLVNGHDQHFVFFDNVRVPEDHLVGGDHQGWQVLQTHLEQEHGGRGQAFPRNELVDQMVEYLGGRKGSWTDPVQQSMATQTAMDAYIDAHIDNLLARRTYWMYQTGREMSHEGTEANVQHRECALRTATRVRDVIGIHAQLDRTDPRAHFKGYPDVYQRTAFAQGHAGGSLNIAKVIVARRIGISRTKERAAPTPATATSFSS